MKWMTVIQSETGYLPKDDDDLVMFKHCCEGMIEVKDINPFIPLFTVHGIAIFIQDETL